MNVGYEPEHTAVKPWLPSQRTTAACAGTYRTFVWSSTKQQPTQGGRGSTTKTWRRSRGGSFCGAERTPHVSWSAVGSWRRKLGTSCFERGRRICICLRGSKLRTCLPLRSGKGCSALWSLLCPIRFLQKIQTTNEHESKIFHTRVHLRLDSNSSKKKENDLLRPTSVKTLCWLLHFRCRRSKIQYRHLAEAEYSWSWFELDSCRPVCSSWMWTDNQSSIYLEPKSKIEQSDPIRDHHYEGIVLTRRTKTHRNTFPRSEGSRSTCSGSHTCHSYPQ